MPNQEDILQAAMQRFVENRDEKFIRDTERELKYRHLEDKLTVARQERNELRDVLRKCLYLLQAGITSGHEWGEMIDAARNVLKEE
ncbi:MAG: hypothetical protein PHQ43_12120 [Dehalococcoidales bacterium]|nr:hypothetical protein [Dehalococcoidales bacterium]